MKPTQSVSFTSAPESSRAASNNNDNNNTTTTMQTHPPPTYIDAADVDSGRDATTTTTTGTTSSSSDGSQLISEGRSRSDSQLGWDARTNVEEPGHEAEAEAEAEAESPTTTSTMTDPSSSRMRTKFQDPAKENGRGYPDMSRNASAQTTSLSRQTSRSSAAGAIISRVRSRDPGADKEHTHPLMNRPTGEECLVDFDGPEDPLNSRNWSSKKKWIATALYGMTTATVTFESSIYSAAIEPIEAEFGVSEEVATLGIFSLLIGFGLGPLVFAPLSELYGRKLAVLTPYAISILFTFGCGASESIQSIVILRFFAGVFGSAPITNSGGVLGDLFTPAERGKALIIYAMSVVGGPTLGPLVGAAITQSYLGWRWTQYITGIFKGTILFLDLLLLDESYGPAILVSKALNLRISSGNWALHAKHEEYNPTLAEIGRKFMVRPFQLLATPICFCIALYASFVYGLLYSLLGAIPYEFGTLRGWGAVPATLPFLAVLVGISVGGGINMLNQQYYLSKLNANNGRPVPEARLPPMMFGSVTMALGLFLFAWLSGPEHFWFGQVAACSIFGMSFFLIFQASLNYLVDVFGQWAASAVGANTFLRSICAASFPLFITYTLEGLGVPWGMSIFAFVAVAMIPIPYLFFIFGKRIRARGKWSRQSL